MKLVSGVSPAAVQPGRVLWAGARTIQLHNTVSKAGGGGAGAGASEAMVALRQCLSTGYVSFVTANPRFVSRFKNLFQLNYFDSFQGEY